MADFRRKIMCWILRVNGVSSGGVSYREAVLSMAVSSYGTISFVLIDTVSETLE